MESWITPELIALKREVLESIYHHRMTVYHHADTFNEETGFDTFEEVILYEDEPCRGSTQLSNPTLGNPREFDKRLRVHCAPELDIPIGAHVVVTFYNGKVQDFGHVSSARHYSDHQVLIMSEFKEDSANYA